jgi:hypothetical protein
VHKQELLTQVKHERAQWDRLLEGISQDWMLLPAAMGDWTFKDLVAHITAWAHFDVLNRLEAVLRQERPSPVPGPAGWNVEQINFWIYATHKYRAVQHILAESRQLWQRMEDLMQALPEQELCDPQRFDWLAGRPLGPTVLEAVAGHFHEEHEAAVQAWLAHHRAGSSTQSS